MIKIKNKLEEYTPNQDEQKVIDELGERVDKTCWDSFKEIKAKIVIEKKEAKEIKDFSTLNKLEKKEKYLIYSRIQEMKVNIRRKYKEELKKQQVEHVCYYCEQQVEDPRGYNYSDLDHILLKHEYPKLTLTPFNLVPICQACNRLLKGMEDVNGDPNLEITEENMRTCNYTIIHPYLDNKSDYYELKEGKIISIKENSQGEIYEAKAQKTIDVFKLNALFSVEGKYNDDVFEENERKIKEFIDSL